ncbi:hypothetical protein [Rhizobium sp. MHM7A]|uniref:hypothetical protein n=1 Tax=Rhizobium sp. MHM7A TaxID=2583233 RepID=UPI0011057BC1|nr:hypothetical protein [Rhizobium sp. MHM7A]TLX16461.1 hypothetical protein FFR93_03755 [Rhizobium sp. MHM7A]
MWNLISALDDKLIEIAGTLQAKACETLSLTPPEFRSKVSVFTLILSSICGVIGGYQLYGTPDFSIWIIPYAMWLSINLAALWSIILTVRNAPIWSAAEHHKLLVGAVFARSNDANKRFIIFIVTCFMCILVAEGFLIGGGHGIFFFSMVTLYFANHAMRGFLAATDLPPLQGRLRDDSSF